MMVVGYFLQWLRLLEQTDETGTDTSSFSSLYPKINWKYLCSDEMAHGLVPSYKGPCKCIA